MGTVWRGWDTRLERAVAVKVVTLAPAGGGDDRGLARARLRREAHAAARVDDPAVVTVFDVIDEGDDLYLVMELVDSPSLDEVVRTRGPLSPAEAAALGVRIAGALVQAHRRGVVHRDLKPANVLVPDGGASARLVDFGIASIAGDPRLTATGLVLGSPSYMAPEQALGRRATPATDAWSLGATLYFAVEAECPFPRPTAMATLTAIVNDEPAPARRAGALEPILRDLLAKDGADRPSLGAVTSRLEAVSTGPAPAATETPTAAMDAVVAVDDMVAVDPVVAMDEMVDVPAPEPAPPPAPRLTPPAPTAPGRPPRPRPPGSPRSAPLRPRRWWPAGPAVLRRAGSARPALSRRLPIAVAVVAAAGLVGGALAWSGSDEPRAIGAGGTLGTATSSSPGDEPVAPAGWVTYTDPATGFTIRHPPDWSVRTESTRTDLVAPGGATLVRVDHTDRPGDDPVQAWQELAEDFARAHDGYEEVRIEAVRFRGLDAAVWEFVHEQDGVLLHTVDLGMVAGDRGFAVLFRTPESDEATRTWVFEQFLAGFEPAGAGRQRPTDQDADPGRDDGGGGAERDDDGERDEDD